MNFQGMFKNQKLFLVLSHSYVGEEDNSKGGKNAVLSRMRWRTEVYSGY